MKTSSGYTVLELLITVSMMSALTAISLISIATPKTLLETESQRSHLTNVIEQAQLQALLKGQALTMAFTPTTLWVNDHKAMEFPQNGPWRWQTAIQKLQMPAAGTMSVTTSTGQISRLPQLAILTYNQIEILRVEADPLRNQVQVVPHAF